MLGASVFCVLLRAGGMEMALIGLHVEIVDSR